MCGNHTSADDWRAAADLLGNVAPANSLAEFGEIVTREVRTIFQADLVVWTTFDRDLRPTGFQMEPDLSPRLGALWEPFQQHFHEHPMSAPATFVDCMAREAPFLLSDYIPVRRHTNSSLFNEVYVHLFAKYQLSLLGRGGPNVVWSLGNHRLSAPFGPRDRELAGYLQKQLNRIADALARRERAVALAGAMGDFFGQAETAWAVIDGSGRIADLSPAARGLLASVPDMGAEESRTQLPPSCEALATAVRVLGAAHAGRVAPVFASVQVTSALSAVALRLVGLRGALVIFQKPPPGAMRPRLTRREAEILAWLGEGKSNAEIGGLLGVSPRTVEKHCGNLFAKIGVETRFAAALFAREGR